MILLWSMVWILVFAYVFIRLYFKFSIKNCVSNVSMAGKVVIVTGANSGIGFHMAKELAMRGARVILACRNERRALSARAKIIEDTNNNDVVFKELDLSSLASVRNFAKNIIETEEFLHVLINNAGSCDYSDRYTKDNIVEMMQVNYFAPFYLTLLLLPLIKKSGPSRIINLTSIAHFIGDINLSKINVEGYYNSSLSYCNSKLGNLIFTVELAKRLKGSGVAVNAVHPGIIATNIFTRSFYIRQWLFMICCFIIGRTPEQGAQTAIHLAVSDECNNVSGEYFVDCSPRYMSWKVKNSNTAKKLWDFSEKMVGFEDVTNSSR